MKPLKTVSAVWRKGMTYAKSGGIWHIAYTSATDHAKNMMVAKTLCDHEIAFDAIARGEDEKSQQVCADCEMLLRAGDALLRTFYEK